MEATPFHCKTCDRPFHSNSRMLEHQRICRKRSHICEFCGQPFLRAYYLQTHLRRGCAYDSTPARKLVPERQWEDLVVLSSDSDNEGRYTIELELPQLPELERLRTENDMLHLQNRVLMEQNQLMNLQMQQYFGAFFYPQQ